MVLCFLNTGAVRDAFKAPWPSPWNKATAVVDQPLMNTQQAGRCLYGGADPGIWVFH